MTDEHHPPVSEAHDGIRGGFSHFEFNADDYRHYLDGEGPTPEQEEELLSTLWMIIVQFVKMGFGLEPIQLLLAAHERGGADENA